MRKYFLRCNQILENIFLFRKIKFPENIYFPENILREPNSLNHRALSMLNHHALSLKLFLNFVNPNFEYCTHKSDMESFMFLCSVVLCS